MIDKEKEKNYRHNSQVKIAIIKEFDENEVRKPENIFARNVIDKEEALKSLENILATSEIPARLAASFGATVREIHSGSR